MTDADETTGFRFYRVAYSYEPARRGWCIFEQDNTCLYYVDGPWHSEDAAKAEMNALNQQQGLKLGCN